MLVADVVNCCKVMDDCDVDGLDAPDADDLVVDVNVYFGDGLVEQDVEVVCIVCCDHLEDFWMML